MQLWFQPPITYRIGFSGVPPTLGATIYAYPSVLWPRFGKCVCRLKSFDCDLTGIGWLHVQIPHHLSACLRWHLGWRLLCHYPPVLSSLLRHVTELRLLTVKFTGCCGHDFVDWAAASNLSAAAAQAFLGLYTFQSISYRVSSAPARAAAVGRRNDCDFCQAAAFVWGM